MSNSGYSASIGVGKETTWGTAVTPTNFMRYRRVDMKTDPVVVDKYGFPGTGMGVPMTTGDVQVGETSGGTVEIDMSYGDSTAFFMAHWIGAVAEGGGGGPTYTHTYTLTDPSTADTALDGFTLQHIKGRIATTDYGDIFEGCLISGGTMSVRENAIATLSMDIIAQTAAARTSTLTSPTFTSADPIMQWHAGNLAWSSLDGKIKSIDITVRRNLERRQLSGSLYTAVPYPKGLYTVEARVVREWDENTVYTAYKARTQANATITFTGPSSQTLAFTLHNCQVLAGSYSDPTTNPGVNDQSFTLRAATNGSNYGIAAVLTNANSVYTTN